MSGAFEILKRAFGARGRESTVQRLYLALAERARNPALFGKLKVPDTLDGRFDSLVLHMAVYAAAVESKADRASYEAFVRELAGAFLADMDRNLREMGVGDLSVGKQVRKMAAAFYGRLAAYGDALSRKGDEALSEALFRNIHRGRPPKGPAVRNLAAYARNAYIRLQRRTLAALLAGSLTLEDFAI